MTEVSPYFQVWYVHTGRVHHYSSLSELNLKTYSYIFSIISIFEITQISSKRSKEFYTFNLPNINHLYSREMQQVWNSSSNQFSDVN